MDNYLDRYKSNFDYDKEKFERRTPIKYKTRTSK
jgi:hypothetical protein